MNTWTLERCMRIIVIQYFSIGNNNNHLCHIHGIHILNETYWISFIFSPINLANATGISVNRIMQFTTQLICSESQWNHQISPLIKQKETWNENMTKIKINFHSLPTVDWHLHGLRNDVQFQSLRYFATLSLSALR